MSKHKLENPEVGNSLHNQIRFQPLNYSCFHPQSPCPSLASLHLAWKRQKQIQHNWVKASLPPGTGLVFSWLTLTALTFNDSAACPTCTDSCNDHRCVCKVVYCPDSWAIASYLPLSPSTFNVSIFTLTWWIYFLYRGENKSNQKVMTTLTENKPSAAPCYFGSKGRSERHRNPHPLGVPYSLFFSYFISDFPFPPATVSLMFMETPGIWQSKYPEGSPGKLSDVCADKCLIRPPCFQGMPLTQTRALCTERRFSIALSDIKRVNVRSAH